ncbi:MAG: CheR family methyltransferase, partial [Planctomycetaceae bacterium]
LIDRVRQGVDPSLEKDVLCAMMTHETSFFRDKAPFESLRTVIAGLVPRRAAERQLTLWSAACSTGQEPYSMAMVLLEHFRDLVATWRIRIIATDFSEPILARAREGVYSDLEAGRGLPPPLLKKYFRPLQGRQSIVQECRQLVEFRHINLNATWPMMPLVDVAFLRNVMLYFDVSTRSALVGRVRRVLRPDGSLYLGGAETMIGIDDGWDRVVEGGCSHYRPKSRR